MRRTYLLCLSALAVWPAHGEEPTKTPETVVAAVSSGGESASILYVCRKYLRTATRREVLEAAYASEGPEGGRVPEGAFYLVERRTDGAESLRWVTYFTESRDILPYPGFGIAAVATADGALFIVVLEARPLDAKLRVFRVAAETKVGDLPLELPPKPGKPWPQAAKPLAEVAWEWARGEEGPLARGGVAHVRALVDSKGILVSADAGASPRYWRFDPRAGTWTRVIVEAAG